ncbi:hypothetical protein CMV_020491 [Castanea mollissima]|uniref:F-box protein At3g26010-like beta-propeller domain-containing protein n=1 Tax=Castanea mollissima TaxID=60419 RepID=A0A8J4QYW2_9ROSI|nr:hypothetical protein CMV_020491 [Castanea mollissima]
MAAESSADLSLVPNSRKRRIKGSEPDPSSSYEFMSINKLSDLLLFEILYRLPCRWALQCKSVSKRWLSLISHPYFIRRYIHHRHSDSQQQQQQPFTLLLQYAHNSEKTILVLPSHNSEFFNDCTNVGLDFLNFLPLKARKNDPFCIEVEASFNDLLLVRNEVSSRFSEPIKFCEYFICNPFTKQWLTLPPRTTSFVMVGFICKPYCLDNVHYRYKVVRIHSPSETNATQLRMEIFSSETGEWRDSVVSSPRGLNSFRVASLHAGVVACNGMLHWVNTDEKDKFIKGFVVFDPFNDAERCHYLDPPIDISPKQFAVSFGEFQGRLRIFQGGQGRNDAYNSYYFSVWDLEDYSGAGTWCMKYKVHFKDMVSEHSEIVQIFKLMEEYEVQPPVLFLAFHPIDDEIVFLQFRHHVVLCNMRTGVLKMAGESLRDKGNSLSEVSGYLWSVPTKYALLLGQPSWPTPVPPLPLKFDEFPSNC